jgi:hypothetical protein
MDAARSALRIRLMPAPINADWLRCAGAVTVRAHRLLHRGLICCDVQTWGTDAVIPIFIEFDSLMEG